MNKTYIGVDNGVTGTISIINSCEVFFSKMPVFNQQSYTKTKQSISRIDFSKLLQLIEERAFSNSMELPCFAIIERPMINSTRFKASISAARALECTLNLFESLGIGYMYIDSKEWQRELLPKGLQKEDLKKASLDIGNRLFPQFKDNKHPDRDSLLIAEYGRRKGF